MLTPEQQKESKEAISSDDLMKSNEYEDSSIMKSIASAERMLGTKMATPKKVAQESFKPVKYDVEDVSIDHSLI